MNAGLPLALPAGCQIRLMQAEDLDAYKALRDAMLGRHDDAFTSDAATERQRSADSYRSRLTLGNGGHTLFTLLAWRDGRLVGAVTCERESRAKVAHIAHLIGMMVADDCQRLGLGAALLQAALQLLRADDTLQQVLLSVTHSNGAALRLYRRHGFERYGQLRQALRLADGRYLDKDLMRCLLRPAR